MFKIGIETAFNYLLVFSQEFKTEAEACAYIQKNYSDYPFEVLTQERIAKHNGPVLYFPFAREVSCA